MAFTRRKKSGGEAPGGVGNEVKRFGKETSRGGRRSDLRRDSNGETQRRLCRITRVQRRERKAGEEKSATVYGAHSRTASRLPLPPNQEPVHGEVFRETVNRLVYIVTSSPSPPSPRCPPHTLSYLLAEQGEERPRTNLAGQCVPRFRGERTSTDRPISFHVESLAPRSGPVENRATSHRSGQLARSSSLLSFISSRSRGFLGELLEEEPRAIHRDSSRRAPRPLGMASTIKVSDERATGRYTHARRVHVRVHGGVIPSFGVFGREGAPLPVPRRFSPPSFFCLLGTANSSIRSLLSSLPLCSLLSGDSAQP